MRIAKTIISFLIVGLLTASLGCATDKALERKKAKAMEDMGLAAVRKGNTRVALKSLEDASKLDPENANIQFELAIVYRDLKEYEKAETRFKKALALKPDFADGWNNLGTLYLLTGSWDKAIASFQKALDIVTYSTPHFAYNNLGLAYYNKGDYQRAVNSFIEALKNYPSYSICLTNLGMAYEAQKKYGKAVESYNMAIQYDPQDPTPHFNLGRLYYRLRDFKKAKYQLERCIELDPKGPFADGARVILRRIR